jgi:hypothetical protein
MLALLASLAGSATAQPSAGVSQPSEPAAEGAGAEDEDPRSIVFFNVRFQHIELGDGNSADLVLFRRDAAIKRPRRPEIQFATLRFDLPVGQTRIQGEDAAGLGDLYFQALNFRELSKRFSLGSGLAFQLPTATDDLLGSGKWQVAPSLFPLRVLPAKRALFFTRIQDFVSVAGDDDRRDLHYLAIAPTFVKLLGSRRAVLLDTEAFVDWERDGELSWRSGLLVGTKLGGRRAGWIKVEVPWGEHRRGDWTVRASIAWRRPGR